MIVFKTSFNNCPMSVKIIINSLLESITDVYATIKNIGHNEEQANIKPIKSPLLYKTYVKEIGFLSICINIYNFIMQLFCLIIIKYKNINVAKDFNNTIVKLKD